MDPKVFDSEFRDLRARQPFQPFLMFFEDGGYVIVDHPESVMVRNNRGVHMDRTGSKTFFEPQAVTRLKEIVDEPERVG
ncbi:MAG: hypothetical protein AAGI46_11710 [Planctomycetota bacterium]